MKLLNRRNFFKMLGTGLGVTVLLRTKSKGLFMSNAIAADEELKDTGINKQDYVHLATSVPEKNKSKHEAHNKKAAEKGWKDASCINCRHYKPVADHAGYGKCAMVGAMSGKPPKLVYEKGWCKVWTLNTKATPPAA